MNTKFTKVPWEVSDVKINGEHVENSWSVGVGGFLLAHVTSGSTFGVVDDIQKANAHLIACAPDMYAEIKRDIECLTRWIDNHGDAFPMTAAWKDMRANKIELLKRARGE